MPTCSDKTERSENGCVWACVACYFTGVATAILAVGYIALSLS